MTLSERINELFQKFNVNLKTEEIEVNLEAQAVLDNGTIIYTDADSFDEGAEVYILNEEGEKIPLPEGEYELEDGSKMSIGEGGKISRAPRKGGEGEGQEGESGEGGESRIGEGGTPPKAGRKPKAPPARKDPPKSPFPPAKDKKAPPKKKQSAQQKLEEEEKKEELNEVEVMEMLVERFPDLDKEMAAAIASAVAEIYAPEVEVVDAEDEKDEEEMKHTPDHKEEDKMYSEQEKLLTELKAQLESQEAELTELKTQAASEGVKRVTSTARKTEPVDLTKLSTEERIKALYNKFNK